MILHKDSSNFHAKDNKLLTVIYRNGVWYATVSYTHHLFGRTTSSAQYAHIRYDHITDFIHQYFNNESVWIEI